MTTAPRSTAAAKARAVSGPVDLDLDTLEREETYEPMSIRIGGKRITLIDARDLDWQVAAALSTDRPHQLFEAIIPKSDQDHFWATGLPLWKMEQLANRYRVHYGLDSPGNSRG